MGRYWLENRREILENFFPKKFSNCIKFKKKICQKLNLLARLAQPKTLLLHLNNKDKSYATPTIQGPEYEIQAAIAGISSETLEFVLKNCGHRMGHCQVSHK